MNRFDYTVVKIGGNVVDNPEALASFLDDFAAIPGPKVLIHGGGKIATKVAGALGIESVMIGGRRVTSPAMLDVAVMVYAGLTNKTIVAGLQARGCNAMGLSGADGHAITSRRRPATPVDYGCVGDIVSVNTVLVQSLLDSEIVPVFCAITCDAQGQLLNTNADSVAQAVATALAPLGRVKLVYCFEKAGILADIDNPLSVIRHITPQTASSLIDDGVIAGGMIPKVTEALRAVTEGGVGEVVIKSSTDLLLNTGTVISL